MTRTRSPRRLGTLRTLAGVAHEFGQERGDLVGRKRQLVADFCRLLGAQFEKPAARFTRRSLPPRVAQTLEHLLGGDSEKQIARRLGVSPNTVHAYVTALYRHFGVSSRSELMSRLLRRPGGISPD